MQMASSRNRKMQKIPAPLFASICAPLMQRARGPTCRLSKQTRRFTSTAEAKPAAVAPEVQEAATPATEAVTKKPMTFGRFLLYAGGAASASTFSYYFYQSGFNLHRTEIAISKRLAQLPFYYPPGPSVSERNTAMPAVELPAAIVEQLSGWFIYRDTANKEGVLRCDVLDLFASLGLIDPEKEGNTDFETVGDEEFRKTIAKTVSSFVEKGRGRLTEYKRQSGVSLQESIELLNALVLMHGTINPDVAETIGSKLDGIVTKMVDDQNSRATAGVPGMSFPRQQAGGDVLPDVEVGERELLEMELSQLEKAKESLSNKSTSLSDAEKGRMSDLDSQIKEVKKLMKAL